MIRGDFNAPLGFCAHKLASSIDDQINDFYTFNRQDQQHLLLDRIFVDHVDLLADNALKFTDDVKLIHLQSDVGSLKHSLDISWVCFENGIVH